MTDSSEGGRSRATRWVFLALGLLIATAAGAAAALRPDAPHDSPSLAIDASRLPRAIAGEKVTAATMSARGDVAVGTARGRIRVFGPQASPVTGKGGADHFTGRSEVTALAVSGDGSTLAASTESGRLAAWRLDTNRPTLDSRLEDPVSALALTADGELLAAAGFDVSVYKALKGRRVVSFARPVGPRGDGQYDAARFSPSGAAVIAASWDGSVEEWSVETGRSARKPYRCECDANGAAISQNARYASFGTSAAHAIVLDLASGRERTDFTVSPISGDHVYATAIDDAGRRFAAGTAAGALAVWRSLGERTPSTVRHLARGELVRRIEMTGPGDRILVELQTFEGRIDRYIASVRDRR